MDEARLELVALAPEGEAVRWRDGRWTGLGARFVGALAAAPDGRGGAHLVGLDGAGRVALGGLDGGWRVIGEAIAGELQALAVGEAGLAVLAIDCAGRVVHAGGPEPGAIGRLEPIGGPRAVLVGGRALAEQGIEVALEDEAGAVHALAWPGWPERPRRPRWELLGRFEELTPPRPLGLPCPRRDPRHADPCALAEPEHPAPPARARRPSSRLPVRAARR